MFTNTGLLGQDWESTVVSIPKILLDGLTYLIKIEPNFVIETLQINLLFSGFFKMKNCILHNLRTFVVLKKVLKC